MRVYAVYLLVVFFSIYAYRHWYRSLCALILLLAFVLHPDMPFNMMGIQGLNPWNFLLLNVLAGWFVARGRETLVWDMPRAVSWLLVLYLFVVLVGFIRMMVDRSYLDYVTTANLISEHLINTIKWAVPGFLLFAGCRTRGRLLGGLACVLGVYFLLAVQVARWIPVSVALSGFELTARSRKIILNEIGFHAVNMSMLLAGASWAILATLPLARRRWHRVLIVAAGLLVMYGQALTAGRMGYVTWAVVGLILCTMRWRKYLLVVPLISIAVALFLPGTMERMLSGFGETDVSGQEITDDKNVTSGRTQIWPLVLNEIGDSPAIGYGRLAMVRTGLSDYIRREFGDDFAHPHNAYLEFLLDNGLLGFVPVMAFYVLIVRYAGSLFLDRSRPMCTAVGGATLALVLALLVAAMGSQTFYPREGAAAMWAAIGLMLRVAVERNRLRQQGVVSRARFRRRRPVADGPSGRRPDTGTTVGA